MACIEGVIVKKLKYIPDERGRLMEIMRSDDSFFQKFGQVYITTAFPGVVKAWHFHRIQADHFSVLVGMAKVALYDNRESSPTFGSLDEFFTGEFNPLLIRIPPFVIHGFKTLGNREIVLLNCPTEPYNHQKPDEYRLPFNSEAIPYQWGDKEERS